VDDVADILRRLAAQGVEVKRLTADSRSVAWGDTFVACPGARTDGRRFIPQAIVAGAGAVLWERDDAFDWDDDWRVPNLGIARLRSVAGPLAAEVYGHPSRELRTIGVTGTNGKTSCSQWIAQAFTAAGRRCAVVGTLGMGFPGALAPNPNTTPDPITLQQGLRRFADAGAEAVAMEVSSIGLDQGRVNGMRFAAALFTNLSRDHLDYHRDMAAYGEAKAQLFRTPGLAHAVLNLDDAFGVRLAQSLTGSAVERVGYSLAAGAAQRGGVERWLEARELTVGPQGIAFRLASSWGEAVVASQLAGRFNAANLLGVLGVLLVSGFALDEAVARVAALGPVPGRMQRIGGGDQPLVLIDYAHSPDALEKVGIAARDLARAQGGRLIVVFGCGGERDRGKRPLMAEAVSRAADLAVVTSDNPRAEDPAAIVAEIVPGLRIAHEVELDRHAAVRRAIRMAARCDVVLLAGKGHEPYQEIAGLKHPYSDAEAARDALGAAAGAGAA
jgi:UDP-N-acetylmuramoyl-L-alanyl-D-glutamate--2,6-diaminopimelate ligase